MMTRTSLVFSLLTAGGLFFSAGLTNAQAQVAVAGPATSTTYETITPGHRTVTYGEKIKVHRWFGKKITVEKPKRFVTFTPPVIQETRVIRPAPIAEQIVVQPAPIVQEEWVQPAPVLERRVIQPAPVIETKYIPQEPVVQTRYLGGAPF